MPRLKIVQDNWKMVANNVNVLKFIIGDGLGVCGYGPETKQQSSQWKLPCDLWSKKAP